LLCHYRGQPEICFDSRFNTSFYEAAISFALHLPPLHGVMPALPPFHASPAALLARPPRRAKR